MQVWYMSSCKLLQWFPLPYSMKGHFFLILQEHHTWIRKDRKRVHVIYINERSESINIVKFRNSISFKKIISTSVNVIVCCVCSMVHLLTSTCRYYEAESLTAPVVKAMIVHAMKDLYGQVILVLVYI